MNVFSDMRVLVTGGAGFLGSHVVDALVSLGVSVVVIDDCSTGTKDNLKELMEKITFIEGSILDDKLLSRAMQGATHVVHAAAFVSVPGSIQDPLRSHETNVTGILKVLLAARDAKAARVVSISSSAVYGSTENLPCSEDAPFRPESPYAAQKMMGEEYAHLVSDLWGLETVRLRPFNIYGPRQNPGGGYAAVIPKFVALMKRGEAPSIFGDGSATRDFIFVDDMVKAILLALSVPDISGGVFNVASGVETTVNDLVHAINTIQGTAIAPNYLPIRQGDITRSVADISRAFQGLGFKAETPFSEGLRKTIESYRA
jgi:nucleoside-diphosphate-sugar epimerase